MNNRQQAWLDELELVPSKEKEGWFGTSKDIYINDDMELIEAYEQAKIWKCGNVSVGYNAALVSLTLPNECGDVGVWYNAALVSLTLPNKCGDVRMGDNAALVSLTLPNECGDVGVWYNAALVSLTLPNKCGDVRMGDNAALVSLTLPNKCGDVRMGDNAALVYFEHVYTDLTGNVCYAAGPVGKEKRLAVGKLVDGEVIYRLGCFEGSYDQAIKAIKDKYQDGLADYLPAYLQAIETIKEKLSK